MEDLTSSVLEFQANLMSLAYRRKTTPVDPESPTVKRALELIWHAGRPRPKSMSSSRHHAKAGDDYSLYEAEDISNDRWVKLGFESENIRSEFARVGLLGLDCLVGITALVPYLRD